MQRKALFIERDRLIMFSDGVFAIVITLLVLEISTGNGDAWNDLHQALPQLGLFAWSFFLIARFWQLHVTLFGELEKRIPREFIDTNSLLLFFVALLPFATKFFDEHFHQPVGFALYAVVVGAIGLIQMQLHRMILLQQPELKKSAIGNSLPYLIIPVLMAISIPAVFLMPSIAYVFWASIVVLSFARIGAKRRAKKETA